MKARMIISISALVFSISAVSTPAQAGMELVLANNSNYCAHMAGHYSNAKNGTNVHLWSCNNNSGSNWEFIDDVYWLEGRIRLIGTNLCLSKSGTDSASNGDNIHLYDCNSGKSANNTWSWEAGVDKMKLKGTNQCLQKKGADSASNGDNLHLWDCNTGATGNKEWYGYFR